MSCLNSRLKIEDKDNQIKKKECTQWSYLIKVDVILKKKEEEVNPTLRY